MPIFVLIIAVVSIALSTVYVVFKSNVWTLTYRELLNSEDEPELVEETSPVVPGNNHVENGAPV